MVDTRSRFMVGVVASRCFHDSEFLNLVILSARRVDACFFLGSPSSLSGDLNTCLLLVPVASGSSQVEGNHNLEVSWSFHPNPWRGSCLLKSDHQDKNLTPSALLRSSYGRVDVALHRLGTGRPSTAEDVSEQMCIPSTCWLISTACFLACFIYSRIVASDRKARQAWHVGLSSGNSGFFIPSL